MAALNLTSTAGYEVHENVRVDTSDHEDHTFCGIMFPIQAKSDLPVSRLAINSVSVRGDLGPMTVWMLKPSVAKQFGTVLTSWTHIRQNSSSWTKIYEKSHRPSRRNYAILDLSENPIVLNPGQWTLIYIHSAAPHDRAIVYDNSRSLSSIRYTDQFLNINSGAAHLSQVPFSDHNIWGGTSAWRDYREFVGQIDFGAVYLLWSPARHYRFGTQFQDVTTTLLACQRRSVSPISMLPDECIYYILHMRRWDWFKDTANGFGAHRRKRQFKAAPSKKKIQPAHVAELRSEQISASNRRSSRRWGLDFLGVIRSKIQKALS